SAVRPACGGGSPAVSACQPEAMGRGSASGTASVAPSSGGRSGGEVAERVARPSDARSLREKTRDELHESGETVMFSHILLPVLAHGSRLIYAPDEVVAHIAGKVFGMVSTACTASTVDARKFSDNLPRDVKKLMKEYWPIMVSFTIGVLIFHRYAQTLKCAMQNTFLGWADWNREMGMVARFFSISALMVVRLIVSNVLPFTSPAFAYLIAKSQPEGEGVAGTFYLLACSMPAGALIPLLDTFAKRYYDCEFLVTKYASIATDYLPFSFWVRPLFMEPAFLSAKKAGFDDKGAASAAVLTGHFMIWAGPATTMHQRMFVPDIITCVLIQPLGLMEDVAVVLATWAGETPQSQKAAQIALYVFMLLMNCVQYITSRSEFIAFTSMHAASSARHLIVGALTLIFLTLKFLQPVNEPSTTSTFTTSAISFCATEHTNVTAVTWTVLQVSAEAVMCSVLAKVLVNCFPCVDVDTLVLDRDVGDVHQGTWCDVTAQPRGDLMPYASQHAAGRPLLG
ncbi:unnamed protein product, partial [Prorocentrum cordatum]